MGLYETLTSSESYTCTLCGDEYDPYCVDNVPVLHNMSIEFTMESGEKVQLNL